MLRQVCGLWMGRALLCCARFASRLISSAGAAPSDVARSVYDEVREGVGRRPSHPRAWFSRAPTSPPQVLRPYHGMIVSSVVTMAFRMAPSRAEFFKRVGADEALSKAELAAFCKYVTPVVESLHKWFVDSGYNFADKA